MPFLEFAEIDPCLWHMLQDRDADTSGTGEKVERPEGPVFPCISAMVFSVQYSVSGRGMSGLESR